MTDNTDGHSFIKWGNQCGRCGIAYGGQDGWIVTHKTCLEVKPETERERKILDALSWGFQ